MVSLFALTMMCWGLLRCSLRAWDSLKVARDGLPWNRMNGAHFYQLQVYYLYRFIYKTISKLCSSGVRDG